MKLSNIIFLVVGAGIGAGGTYMFMKDRFDTMINEELEEIKSYYEKEANDKEKELEEAIIEDSDVEKEPEKPTLHSINKQKAYDNEIMKTNYHQFSNKVEKTEEIVEEDNGKEPFVIGLEEFNDYNGHIKRTLSYYPESDVLYDEELDEVVDDIDGTLGRINIDNIANDGDMSELYIRNYHLGTDFEVCLEVGEFNPEEW